MTMCRSLLLALSATAAIAAPLGAIAGADASAPKRESIEWTDVWIVEGDHPEATPRILLIGDSITRGYYDEARKALDGVGPCDRLATSASLGDPALPATIALVLGQRRYDVIHINNGMHGWGYSEAEYAAAIPPLLATLRRLAPQARIVWATTTPTAGPAAERNPRIDERNRLLLEALKGQELAIDDLHAVIAADPAQISKDGVHLAPLGSLRLATQVAKSVKEALAKSGGAAH
jgi:lysophospholipase L1-like esterase